MSLQAIIAVLFSALTVAAAEAPLPELRIEPIGGGSLMFVKNVWTQPLTAYLIELVDYPGSSYSFWQDETNSPPIAAGVEKRIQITNMTVGAVPDYVKILAAVYADGASSGVPVKVTQLLERRRFTLKTAQDLIARLAKAQAAGMSKAAAIADLKQWAESIPAPTRSNRNSQPAIEQAAAKALISDTAAKLETQSLEETLVGLRAIGHQSP